MAKKHERAAEKRPRKVRHHDHTGPVTRLIALPALALGLALIVESFNRGLSPARLWQFVSGRPLAFLYNVLIILATLAFSELFKRRRAVLATTCIAWVVLGVVQYIVIKDRTQPFCSVDILMLKDAFSLITIYYTWPQIILMFTAGFAAVALVVVLFTRMKRRRRVNYTVSVLVFLGLAELCAMLSAMGIHSGFFPRRFENLVDAYNDYGFATCFTFTFGARGISKPDQYSTENVAEILADIEAEPADAELTYPVFDEDDNLSHPNIVFVQLESFFDVSTIKGCEVSADPTINFDRLCRNFPSGLLYVPTIGGGTANTEFEVLTGLNLDFFGAGEYPYNTILQETAVETACTDLREYGYVSTAMHNNSGTFYSRNIVYPNLGFDRFVPLEYMRDMKYNSLGWAKDAELTGEILRALESSEARDFVFCISVESHGKYADTYEPKEGDIEVLSLPEQIPLAPFQNFVNILPTTDDFLRALIHSLVRFNEPTVVVAYGDHLPAMELESDMLTTGSIYASRYVIWNNYGAQFEAPDLQAYRLGANLMKQLGFSGDVVTRYHQANEPGEAGEAYLDKLEMLQYDMLYGDMQAFEGESPYAPTDMAMGSAPVEVSEASLEYHRLLVTGDGFTEFSRVVVDDEPLATAYVDAQHIIAPVDDDAEIERFTVAQVARDGTVLGATEPFELAG
ncbi:MAG: LTA synthase family protein [Clostridia bacterium]|nr:LTA synthase family protein [Clostridia bacterium]